MSRQHPYKALENTPEWRAIEKAVADLVRNGDMVEQTARQYVVGYITQHVRALSAEKVFRLVDARNGVVGKLEVTLTADAPSSLTARPARVRKQG